MLCPAGRNVASKNWEKGKRTERIQKNKKVTESDKKHERKGEERQTEKKHN